MRLELEEHRCHARLKRVKYIFPSLPCCHTALCDGELKPFYPSMVSSQPPDSIDKKSDFTWQNTGAAGHFVRVNE